MSSSSQQSSSSSISEPVVIRTPENDIIDAISGVASGIAQQMMGWAQDQFAKTSRVTDQAVGNFFQVSQQMQGLSNNLTNQYNNIFAPQNASLAREADQYNSTARRELNMGAAGATAAMAGANALKGAEESLRSYGIDPSSGRYAALDKAAAVQNAANIAGAENMQRDRDVATGQRLRSEAVQVGAQLPAAIANVNNTMIQANTGASNASLANANTGANLYRLPNEYLKTAMDVKLPPTGQKSNSSSQSTGQSNSPSPGSGGGGSGGGGPGSGGGSGGGGPGWNPTHGDAQERNGGGAGYGRIQPGTAAGITHLKPYDADDYSDPTGNNYDGTQGIDPNSFSGNDNYYQPQDGYNMNVGQEGYSDNPFQDYGNPFADKGFGQEYPDSDYDTFTGGEGATNTPWGNINYDPEANSVDTGWDNLYDTPQQTDWGNGASGYQDYGQGGGGSSPNYDTTSPSSDSYAGDYSGNYEDYGGVYARGGPVPGYAGGGQVPQSMSPSGGRQVDDVPAQSPAGPARLNANEFVIPQDVALWKGQEFFQKLIDQSRMRNATAPAKPQMQPMR